MCIEGWNFLSRHVLCCLLLLLCVNVENPWQFYYFSFSQHWQQKLPIFLITSLQQRMRRVNVGEREAIRNVSYISSRAYILQQFSLIIEEMCLQHMCIKFEFENGSICLWGYDYDVDNGDDDDIEMRRTNRKSMKRSSQKCEPTLSIEHEHFRN